MTISLPGLILLIVGSSLPGSVLAADRPAAPITAAPGTVVRWSAPGTTRCGMLGRTWAALQETCYYPIDLLKKPGVIVVARVISGRRETARIAVGPSAYGTEAIDLPDIPQAHPSAGDLKRDSRDQVLVGKAWTRPERQARFALPLGDPARPLPEGKSFGAKRIFNGKPAAQPHTGCDYATPAGSPILAAADGTVVVAEDLFFAGNAVFIDHGNSLFTMYFHLSEIKVAVGQEVTRGEVLGAVGSTGRSTGPHLFFAVRWHNARVDPAFLLGAPARIPAVDAVSKPAAPPPPSRRTSSKPVR